MKQLLIVIALLCVVGVGAAFYLGWLNLSTANSYDNRRSEVTLTIDKEKVKEDLDAVKQKATEAGKKITQTAKETREEIQEHARAVGDRKDIVLLSKTLDGQIQGVDMKKQEVTVKGNDGKDTLTVKVDAATKIKVGDKEASLADVKLGDTVTLVHMPKDGVDTAVSLWIKPTKA